MPHIKIKEIRKDNKKKGEKKKPGRTPRTLNEIFKEEFLKGRNEIDLIPPDLIEAVKIRLNSCTRVLRPGHYVYCRLFNLL